MKSNEESNQKRCFIIPLNSKSRATVLVEIALSRGMQAWLEEGNRFEVIICADESEVESAVQTAQEADDALRFRMLEALALTVQGIGETPSEALKDAIALARRRAGFEKKGNGLPPRLDRDNLNGLN